MSIRLTKRLALADKLPAIFPEGIPFPDGVCYNRGDYERKGGAVCFSANTSIATT